MSSSSSIAAARRRRASGAPSSAPPTPNQQPQSPSAPPQGNGVPLNPLAILQQHHVKIKQLEQMVNEMKSQHDDDNRVNDLLSDRPASNATVNGVISGNNTDINKQINANEFSDMIISRIESQLDLKAFYDNDTRLASEIESLHKLVQSQQIVINELNTTMFYMLQRLDIGLPSRDSDDLLSTQNVTFDISNNDTYSGMDDDDSLSNYEGEVQPTDNGI